MEQNHDSIEDATAKKAEELISNDEELKRINEQIAALDQQWAEKCKAVLAKIQADKKAQGPLRLQANLIKMQIIKLETKVRRGRSFLKRRPQKKLRTLNVQRRQRTKALKFRAFRWATAVARARALKKLGY